VKQSTGQRFDVGIVGGGLVGLSLAARLGEAGFKTALVEARAPQADWPAGSTDIRVYALSRASQRLLQATGAWPVIEPFACAYTDMRVWDAGGSGDIHFDSEELGEPELGHIVESRVVERALFDIVRQLPDVTLFCPRAVQSLEDDGGRKCIVLDDGRQLLVDLLVGADGKHSQVRDFPGIHAVASAYDQKALVAVVDTERGHAATAWQRFLPTGPLAFLPLRNGLSSIVWSANSSEAERLVALDDEAFCQALGDAFEHRLGRITGCGERVLFPLVKQYAEHYVAPGVALLGDALHVIHPLAGQGVNLGFKDVAELVAVLVEARGQGRAISSLSVLRRFERARKGDNMATMLAMDGFKHLFGSSAPPLRWLRNTGLNLVNAAPPVKNAIMRAAMGLN